MKKYIPILDGLGIDSDDLADVLIKYFEFPKDFRYLDIDDNCISRTSSVYHNQTETEILETDSNRVQLANALKLIIDNFKNYGD